MLMIDYDLLIVFLCRFSQIEKMNMQGLRRLEAKSYSGMGIVFLVFLQCQDLLVCIPSLLPFYPCVHVHLAVA